MAMNDGWSRRSFVAGLGAAAMPLARLTAQSQSAPGLGFVGLGLRSKVHFAALKQLPGVRVVAICDIESARMEQADEALTSDAKRYTNYRELLDDKHVGAVVIATPNYLHYEMTIAALRAGKHVLLETPLAIHYQRAKEIRDEAQRSGRVLGVVLERLYGADGLLIELLRRGEIGDVRVIDVGEYRGDWDARTWPFTDPRTGRTAAWKSIKRAVGSSELECCVPSYAALSSIVNSPMTSLTASGGTLHYKDRDTRDASSTIVEFANGLRVSHDFGMFSPLPSFVNVFGNKGSLRRMGSDITLYAEDGKPRNTPVFNPPPEQQTMIDLYNDFFDCILTQGTLIASTDLAMEACKIAFGLDLSITQNRRVTARDFV